MRSIGLQGLRLRRRCRTTIADPAAAKAPDLIGRDFTAAAPNQRYVGDAKCRRRHLKSYADRRSMPIIPALVLVTPLLRFGRSA